MTDRDTNHISHGNRLTNVYTQEYQNRTSSDSTKTLGRDDSGPKLSEVKNAFNTATPVSNDFQQSHDSLNID